MADTQELLLQQIKEQGELVRKLKAAKESTEKACVSNKGREQYDLIEIDSHFSRYSYICGFRPSNCDVTLAKNVSHIDFSKYIYIKRWWDHMRSFNSIEVSQFPILEPPDVMTQKPKGNSKSLELQVCDHDYFFHCKYGLAQ